MIKRLIRASDPRLEQWRDALQWRNDPSLALDCATLDATIAKVFRSLTPREEKVLALLFGVNGKDPHSYDEVAAMFQVNRGRVKQIEKKALRKLRREPRANQLKVFIPICRDMRDQSFPLWPDPSKRKYVPRPKPLPTAKITYGEIYTDPSSLPTLQSMIDYLDERCSVIDIEQRDPYGLRSTCHGFDVALQVLRFKGKRWPIILLGWQSVERYLVDTRFKQAMQYPNVSFLRLPVSGVEITREAHGTSIACRYGSYNDQRQLRLETFQ
jgi:hypothetical protein